MTRLAVVLAIAVALFAAAAASASGQHPTLLDLENEVMCPTCHTTLELSQAPAADRIRAFIRREIAAGKTKSEIKDDLVAQFGVGILASPPASGFNLLAWLLPIVGGLAAIVALAWAARRWLVRRPEPLASGAPVANGAGSPGAVDRDVERRLDEELARFDG